MAIVGVVIQGVVIVGVVFRGVAFVCGVIWGGAIFLFTSAMEEDHEDDFIDMSREFTCYLCNGYTTVIGSISINEAGIRLTNAAG